jgi:pilus assembly protein FimV
MKVNFKKLILPASLFVAIQSHALGLGNLQVNSALDETLKADISLMIAEGETVEELSVYLASSEEYKKVGLDKSFVPSNIQLEVVENGGDKLIKLSSIGSVGEPIVSLLLVVDWKNGHLLREYTLLLDPPVFGVAQNQNIESNKVQTSTYNPNSTIEEETKDEVEDQTTTYTQTESQSQPTTIDNTSFNNQVETVVVESGDTLWRIASRYTTSDTNPQQMMVAIFDENPTAFSNNDMNRLKKGAELTIPSSDVASAISFQQALSEVKAQIEQYKQETSDYSSSGTDSSSDVDYGIEIVPPRDSSSTTGDSSSSSGASSTESLAELSRTKEELVSVNLENQELSERVGDLEEIVKDQEVALQIKDDNLAQLQQQIGEKSLDDTISDPETSEVDVTAVDDSVDDDLSDVANLENEDESLASDDTNVEQENQFASTDDGTNDDESSLNSDDVWDDDLDSNAEDSSETIEQEDDGSLALSEETETSDDSEAGTITIVDEAADQAETDNQITPPAQSQSQPMSFMDKAMQYKTEGMIGLGALLAILGFLFFRNRRAETVDVGGSFLDNIGKEKSNEDLVTSDEDGSSDLEESTDEDEDSLSDIIEDVDEAIESLDDDLEDVPAVTVMNEIDDEYDELDELVNDSEEVIDLVSDELDEDFDLESDSTEDLDLEFTEDEELSTEDADNLFDLSEEDSESLDLDLDEGVSVDDFNDELDSLIDGSNDEEESAEESNDSTSTELELGDDEFDDLMNEVDQELNLDDLSLDFDSEDDSNDDEKNSAEEFLEQNISLDLDLDSDNAELDEVAEDSSDLEDLVFDTGEVKIINEDNIDNDLDDDNEIEIDHEDDIDIGLDLDDLVTDDAVDTKLDLAKAYFEMGDLDGAMQMVTEIFEEGSEEQQTMAQELKDEIEKS